MMYTIVYNIQYKFWIRKIITVIYCYYSEMLIRIMQWIGKLQNNIL